MPVVTRPRMVLVALTLSAAGFVGITQYESYEPVAKPPVVGDVCTGGFGATHGVRCGEHFTPERALARALHDTGVAENAVQRCVHVPLAQYEYDAYVSLAYNIGQTAFCSSTLVRKLNAGDYAGACAEISRWNRFKGRPLAGLTKRRASERAKCEGR